MRWSGKPHPPRRVRRYLLVSIAALAGAWAMYHFGGVFLKSSERSDPSARLLPEAATEAGEPDSTSLVSLEDGESLDLPLLAGSRSTPPPPTKPSTDTQPAPNPARRDRPDPKVRDILAQADRLIQQDKTIAARTVLMDFLATHFADPASLPVREKALELGRQTILSPKIHSDDHVCRAYRIEAGDTLDRLARKNKIPYQFLARINQITDPRRLMEGQKIKMPRGPVHLKVIKSELSLYVFLQDVLFARYDVCLGKDEKTPAGRWLVEDRVRKPVYVDPDTKEVFGPNDPNNPTGGFWIRLQGVEGDAVGKTGFGIHGTNEPDTIKQFLSKGCVRLRNEDMAQLFDLLTPGVSEVYTLP